MDKATLTMIENLHKNTGKTLEEWITIANGSGYAKHGEIVKWLKESHGLTHGFANLVSLKARGTDAGSAADQDELIVKQYQGKEHFKPLYDHLIAAIQAFGDDVEIAPKNAYVSLRRKKQFATLGPATKTRFEVGINLKGQAPAGRLEAEKPNAMCSHKISLTGLPDADEEVLRWLRAAYDHAG
jgi:hypothetical protein